MIDPIVPRIELESVRLQGEWLVCQGMCHHFILMGITAQDPEIQLWYTQHAESLITQRHAIEAELQALVPQLRRN